MLQRERLSFAINDDGLNVKNRRKRKRGLLTGVKGMRACRVGQPHSRGDEKRPIKTRLPGNCVDIINGQIWLCLSNRRLFHLTETWFCCWQWKLLSIFGYSGWNLWNAIDHNAIAMELRVNLFTFFWSILLWNEKGSEGVSLWCGQEKLKKNLSSTFLGCRNLIPLACPSHSPRHQYYRFALRNRLDFSVLPPVRMLLLMLLMLSCVRWKPKPSFQP